MARAIVFVAVLRAGGGLLGLAWASLAMNLLGHGLSFLFVRRLLPTLRISPRLVTRDHLGMIGGYSSVAFVGAVASSIAFQTDSLVITAFIGAAAVTPFAIASGLVDNVRSLVHSASYVLAHRQRARDQGRNRQAARDAGGRQVLGAGELAGVIGLLVFGEAFLVT